MKKLIETIMWTLVSILLGVIMVFVWISLRHNLVDWSK
jgi:hypothetical protein